MRIKPNESIADWAKRVQQYEYGYALQQIAKGEDVNVVMEAMSARIVQKMMHPIVKSIQEGTTINPEEFEQSKIRYNEVFSKRGPVADHVQDD
jgi:glutamyl-tRNA reductase